MTSANKVVSVVGRWLTESRNVSSVVLFGSHAREVGNPAAADAFSDVDFHVIARDASAIERVPWERELPELDIVLNVVRPASGGVRKLTLLFGEGEADIVIVPRLKMRLARFGMRLGMHRRKGVLANALNAMATIMGGGYRFIKGEREWGAFYKRVVSEMGGVRIGDSEAVCLANTFLCVLLWLQQKMTRGELVAAQRMLHRSLMETNVVLLHELRLRRQLPTYQQARRVEQFASIEELHAVQVSARLDAKEIGEAARQCLQGLQMLMGELVPTWTVSPRMSALLARG